MTCRCNTPLSAVVEGKPLICDCQNGQALWQRRIREWDEGEEIWSRARWMLHVNAQAAEIAASELREPATQTALSEGEAGPSRWLNKSKSVDESCVSLYVNDSESVTLDEYVMPSTGPPSEASGVTCFRCNSGNLDTHEVVFRLRSLSAPAKVLSRPVMDTGDPRAAHLGRGSLIESAQRASKEVLGAPCESVKETRMLKSAGDREDSAVDCNMEWAAMSIMEKEYEVRRVSQMFAEFELRPAPTPLSTPERRPSDGAISPMTPCSPMKQQAFPSFDETIAAAQMAAYDSHDASQNESRVASASCPLSESAGNLGKIE